MSLTSTSSKDHLLKSLTEPSPTMSAERMAVCCVGSSPATESVSIPYIKGLGKGSTVGHGCCGEVSMSLCREVKVDIASSHKLSCQSKTFEGRAVGRAYHKIFRATFVTAPPHNSSTAASPHNL